MKINKGNLWESNADVILVTANSYLKNDGSLAMGKGAALEMKNRFPKLPHVFGEFIKNKCGHLGFYGVCISPENNFSGVLQTKYHYKDESTIDLIEKSLMELTEHMDLFAENVGYMQNVAVNYPGIGFGKLSMDEVEPTLYKVCENYPIGFYYIG